MCTYTITIYNLFLLLNSIVMEFPRQCPYMVQFNTEYPMYYIGLYYSIIKSRELD